MSEVGIRSQVLRRGRCPQCSPHWVASGSGASNGLCVTWRIRVLHCRLEERLTDRTPGHVLEAEVRVLWYGKDGAECGGGAVRVCGEVSRGPAVQYFHR